MKFENVLKLDSEKMEVFLGYKDNDKYSKINLINNPSIIITGSSGTSKSVLLNEILIQLVKKNNPDELKILAINPTIVELLPYKLSKYSLDTNISIKCSNINEITKIVTDRVDEILESGKSSFKTYNNSNDTKLPYIVIAIDEATLLLQDDYAKYGFAWIMSLCKKIGVILILTTNNIYNTFFEDDYNNNASVRISFDLTDEKNAELVNIEDSENLSLKDFLIRVNTSKEELYHSFEFNESIVDKML